MKVKEIMSTNVTKVSPDTSLKQVSVLMKKYDIGFIVITKEDEAIGVITDRDLVIRSLMEDGNKLVKEYMTKEVISVDADSNIETALDLLAEHKINRLVVTHDNKVVGVLAISDIMNSSFDQDILYCIEEIKSPIDVYVVHEVDIPDIQIDTYEL